MKKSKKADKKPLIERFNQALSICSTSCLFRIARLLAFFVERTDNQISRQTTQSIRLCFAEMTPSHQKKLVRKSIIHTCCAFTELAFLWHQPIEKVLGKVSESNVDQAFYRTKNSKIIIVPHHGSWELMIYWLAQQGDFYTLYKPAKTPALDDYIYRKRTRNHARLVPTTTAGVRALLKALKKQGICMILPDQIPPRNTARTQAPFFNHEADTSLLVKNLAQKTDCDLFIAAATRDLENGRYKINLETVDRDKILAPDPASASYLNQAIEKFISQHICQYQWAYRRFPKQLYASN